MTEIRKGHSGGETGPFGPAGRGTYPLLDVETPNPGTPKHQAQFWEFWGPGGQVLASRARGSPLLGFETAGGYPPPRLARRAFLNLRLLLPYVLAYTLIPPFLLKANH